MKFLTLIILLQQLTQIQAQQFNPELIKYTGNVFKQAATGSIVVFDSLMRKLPADSLYNRFVSAKPNMADNLSNNYYTRNSYKEAAFINAFHYGLFEGAMGLPDLPAFLFDTLTYKPNPKLIIFRLYRYNDDGSFIGKKKLFLINRNFIPVNKKLLADRVLKSAADSQNSAKVKLLITTVNEYWCNTEILVNNKKTEMDMCQSRYHLILNADIHFKQYYDDTSLFDINRKAGIDTGIERGFYTPRGKQHIQCYLESETGIWAVKNDRLLLMTSTGITLNNYRIVHLKKGQMSLQVRNYTIKMIKKQL